MPAMVVAVQYRDVRGGHLKSLLNQDAHGNITTETPRATVAVKRNSPCRLHVTDRSRGGRTVRDLVLVVVDACVGLVGRSVDGCGLAGAMGCIAWWPGL